MIHIPIIRHGAPYQSLDTRAVFQPETGEKLATMSLANPGLIRLDSKNDSQAAHHFRGLSTRNVISMLQEAGERFVTDDLEIGPGGPAAGFDDYIEQLSSTTGLPLQTCRSHAQRLRSALINISATTEALSYGRAPAELDEYFQDHAANLGNSVAVVLPSNAPGVNGLWLPLLAYRTPLALKPGHADPWTPLRLIAACIQAGMPSEIFSFYPSDHAGGRALLTSKDAGMIFGSDETTSPYENNPRIQRNGAGYSKVIFGADTSPDALSYLPFLEECVIYNSGRSCTNTSTIVVTTGAETLAKALADQLANVEPMPLDSPQAILAGYPDKSIPEAIVRGLDHALEVPGAIDLSRTLRGSGPIEHRHDLNFLLPTVILCTDTKHPLAQVEYPFPLVAIVELAEEEVEPWLRRSLAITAITENEPLLDSLKRSPKVASFRRGPIPTTSGNWQSPHIGNVFELIHLDSTLVSDGGNL